MQISRLTQPRLWIGLAVTLAWLASMAALVRREGGLGGSGLRELGISPEVLLVQWASEYEHCMEVTQNGRRLGFTELQIASRAEETKSGTLVNGRRVRPGYRMESRTRLEFAMLGMHVPLDIQMRSDLNQAFELTMVQAQASLAEQRLVLQGFVENDNLYYRVRLAPENADWSTTAPLAGAKSELDATSGGMSLAGLNAAALLKPRDVCGRTPLAGPILMSDAIVPILMRSEAEKFKPGRAWTTHAAGNLLAGKFDDTVRVRVESQEKIDVGGESMDAWRLTERMGPAVSTVWYDMAGTLLRRDMAAGLRLTRVEFKQAAALDPELKRVRSYPPFDRGYIRTHLTPELTDKPLAELLPALPQM